MRDGLRLVRRGGKKRNEGKVFFEASRAAGHYAGSPVDVTRGV